MKSLLASLGATFMGEASRYGKKKHNILWLSGELSQPIEVL
jgi:hypothetical protein